MICPTCEDGMVSSDCYDNPVGGSAYNLYTCYRCGTIVKENVWNNPCLIIITEDNTIYTKQLQ